MTPSSPPRMATNPLSSYNNSNDLRNDSLASSIHKQQQQQQQTSKQQHHFDSPGHTTITTTVSSFDDDDDELTPQPLPERLGRVISDPEDCSEGSDDDENNVMASSTTATTPPMPPTFLPLPRRPMARRTISAGSVQYDRWLAENGGSSNTSESASNAMAMNTLQELQQLNRLASMDSNDYHAQLLDNSLPSLSSSSSCGSSSKEALSQPPLTLIPNQMVQLSMSIHRLHSMVTNLTQEVDGHTDDTKDLQALLQETQERNRQLETALQKLYQKNQKLSKNSEKDKTTINQLQTQVSDYQNQLETQGFELMASQVQQHELLMLQKKRQQQEQEQQQLELSDKGGSSVASSITRDRTDSNFCELCLEDIGMDVLPPDVVDEMESVVDGKAEQNATSAEDVKDDWDASLFASTGPTLCFSVKGSIGSAITRARTFSGASVVSISQPNKEEEDADKLEATDAATTNESSTSRTSADSRTVETKPCNDDSKPKSKSEAKDTKPPLPGIMSNLNMNFNFLSNRPATNYTLRMKAPFNMQFTALEMTAKEGSKERAFVVIGFQGFDEDINVKPTLGARLMRINGVPIGPKCTLDGLQNALYGGSNNTASKSLTFRNEEWDAAQKKMLNASIVSKSETVEGGATQNEIVEGETKSKVGNDMVFDQRPRSRSRAGSAEAVGKAIGNFFQNVKQQHNNSDKPQRKNS